MSDFDDYAVVSKGSTLDTFYLFRREGIALERYKGNSNKRTEKFHIGFGLRITVDPEQADAVQGCEAFLANLPNVTGLTIPLPTMTTNAHPIKKIWDYGGPPYFGQTLPDLASDALSEFARHIEGFNEQERRDTGHYRFIQDGTFSSSRPTTLGIGHRLSQGGRVHWDHTDKNADFTTPGCHVNSDHWPFSKLHIHPAIYFNPGQDGYQPTYLVTTELKAEHVKFPLKTEALTMVDAFDETIVSRLEQEQDRFRLTDSSKKPVLSKPFFDAMRNSVDHMMGELQALTSDWKGRQADAEAEPTREGPLPS